MPIEPDVKSKKRSAKNNAADADGKRLQGIVELASSWYYWEQDRDYRFTVLTGSVFEKLRLDPQDYLGKTRWEFGNIPVNASWECHRALLDGRRPFTDFLIKYVDPHGEPHFFSINGQPIFDGAGRFTGYRGISRDVTQDITSERRLTMEHGVTRVLAESDSMTAAAAKIIETICAALGWACGARWETRENTGALHCAEMWGDGSAGIGEFLAATRRRSPVTADSRGVVRRACAEGEPVWIVDVTEDRSFLRLDEAQAAGLRSALAFPIKAGAKIIGAMEFFSKDIQRPNTELLNSAVYIGSQIGQFLQRQQAEAALRQREALLHDILQHMDQGITCADADLRLVAWNRRFLQLLDFPESLCHERAAYADFIRYNAVRGEYGPGPVEEHVQRRLAQARRFEAHRQERERPDGTILDIRADPLPGGGFVTTYTDVTQRRRAEQASARLGKMYAAISATNEAILRAKSPEDLYQRVCDAAVDGGKFVTTAVLLPEASGKTLRVAAATGAGVAWLRGIRMTTDPAAPEGQGLTGTAFRTHQPCVSNDYLQDARTRPWHESGRAAGTAAAAALPLLHRGACIGSIVFYSGEKNAFDDEIVKLLQRMAENIVFALDNFEREAERKRAEERIQYLATHDSLTDLPNRVMFSQLLSMAIESARRYQRQFAVFFIDLDRFKTINDTLGHEAGDKLLQEAALRLKEILRASDVVARLGGDEFVVLVQEAGDANQATIVARKVLSAAIKPMVLMGQECRVTASIGIAMYPKDGDNEQTLMKNADAAMYLAKEEGKNNFQFYSKGIKTQSLECLALEANLQRALERNEFLLHYQAKRSLKSGAITGVEALLRWRNPELGTVPPSQFIPLAEETGLIVPIGRWVLRSACVQNVAWQRAGLPPVCIAVNLSSRQFADEELLEDIAATLRETGMAPEWLELELTEGTVIRDPERAVKMLTAIKRLGVRLAIDDFGTGYSSLAHLKRFPLDTLKVDRSFIRDIPRDAEDKAITEAIIVMAKTLSLTVVAEGVETQEQEEFLREHACDEIQGYHFSKPVEPERFAELLRQQRPSPR